MKKVLFVFLFLNFQLTNAAELFNCQYKNFKISFYLQKMESISFEVKKGNEKVMGCLMKPTLDNIANAQSDLELIRLKKINCNLIYDNVAKEIEFVDEGYLKRPINSHEISTYIIKNEMPFICKLDKKNSK